MKDKQICPTEKVKVRSKTDFGRESSPGLLLHEPKTVQLSFLSFFHSFSKVVLNSTDVIYFWPVVDILAVFRVCHCAQNDKIANYLSNTG